jgi:hypothetical protein
MNKLALEAVAVAWEEIGNGEEGRNNDGPHCMKYSKGKVGSWCATFVSWCFEEAASRLKCPCCGQRQDRYPERTRGSKRMVRNTKKLGHYVDVVNDYPAPGDVVCWHRRAPGEPFKINWRGHVGFVYGYENETDTLITIEGNSGRFPAKVKIKRYPQGKWRKRLYKIARME